MVLETEIYKPFDDQFFLRREFRAAIRGAIFLADMSAMKFRAAIRADFPIVDSGARESVPGMIKWHGSILSGKSQTCDTLFHIRIVH